MQNMFIEKDTKRSHTHTHRERDTHTHTLIVSAIYAIIMCNMYLEFTRFHWKFWIGEKVQCCFLAMSSTR